MENEDDVARSWLKMNIAKVEVPLIRDAAYGTSGFSRESVKRADEIVAHHANNTELGNGSLSGAH